MCPESNADIPDTDEARLIVLHPKVAHKRGSDSPAKAFAQKATEQRGTANRTNRNMLVFWPPTKRDLRSSTPLRGTTSAGPMCWPTRPTWI